MKITIADLSKAYGGRDLFKDFSLEVNSGIRLAVVGANGTGKTTFLKMLSGASAPDSGRVIFPKGARVGYVAQELSEAELTVPLLNWVLEVLPSWRDFWAEWEAAGKADDHAAMERLARRQAELEEVYGYNPEHRAHAVLSGLGFAVKKHDRLLSTFSGGWRERAKLARVLVAGADVLLLDEPTNHLDLEAVEWLEQFLLDYKGALVFVAHDRVFMERVGTHVLYLGLNKPLFRRGTFSSFLEWQEELEEQRRREAKKLASEIERKMDFVRRFKAKATKARQAGSRKKQAQRLEKELGNISFEQKRKTLSFRWPEPKRGEKTVASAVDVAYGHDQERPPLFSGLNFNLFRGQKIALAGPNGCGKTTLLKVLVGEKTPTQGHVELGSTTSLGYFTQHQTEILDPERQVLSEIRRLSDPKTSEEELMSVLGLFMLGENYFERPVRELSGGEKSRLILASLFLARANFLVLDEPTNHLDLESREALIEALDSYTGTLLFVAHDRWLMSQVADEIWSMSDKGIEVFVDGFEAYEAARRREADPKAARQALAQAEAKSSPAEAAKPELSRDEQKRFKRIEAERRNELYREVKPKRKALEAKEQELEAILTRVAEVEKTLADPEVYADSKRTTELLGAYRAMQDKSEVLLESMAVLEAEIRELEGRFGEGGE